MNRYEFFQLGFTFFGGVVVAALFNVAPCAVFRDNPGLLTHLENLLTESR